MTCCSGSRYEEALQRFRFFVARAERNDGFSRRWADFRAFGVFLAVAAPFSSDAISF
jgi:hypothetical protein